MLRFWELPTLAVVLGAGGSVAIDVNVRGVRGRRRADPAPGQRRRDGAARPRLPVLQPRAELRPAPGLDDIPPRTGMSQSRGQGAALRRRVPRSRGRATWPWMA